MSYYALLWPRILRQDWVGTSDLAYPVVPYQPWHHGLESILPLFFPDPRGSLLTTPIARDSRFSSRSELHRLVAPCQALSDLRPRSSGAPL
jgi:hypothetical protein